MERANFEEKISKKDYVERTNSKPIETFIPNQAMNLKELVSRFERGQRLNVHENFRPGSNFTEGSIYEEDFEDAAPDDIHDVVDVQEYYRLHNERKSTFKKKQEEKRTKKEVSTTKDDDLPPTLPAS